MATSCTERLARIEEEVLVPISESQKERKKKCKKKKCCWKCPVSCVKKLFCWFVWVITEITLWVTQIVVRWGFKLVCVLVSIIIGILSLVLGRTDILMQALKDAWGLVKDGFNLSIGILAYFLVNLGLVFSNKHKSRKLQPEERAILRRVFDESLNYDLIRIIEGKNKILNPTDRPYVIGYKIFDPLKKLNSSLSTFDPGLLVHENVHVWQFQFGGTRYIGQSLIAQEILNEDVYEWSKYLDISNDNAWYLTSNVEAQAAFIEFVFRHGIIYCKTNELCPDNLPNRTDPGIINACDRIGVFNDDLGAFFIDPFAVKGKNCIKVTNEDGEIVDYTKIANNAWAVLKIG